MIEKPELRKLVESERSSWPGRRWRCSPGLRQEIVEATKAEIAGGASLRKVAREIGVPSSSLERWLAGKTRARSCGFRKVEVAEELKEDSRLVLVTPNGYRVEGLKVEQLVTLLASLG